MKQEHTLSCQVSRYLRMRGYVTLDCDVMSALKYLPVKNDRDRAMFVNSRKAMGYTLGQADLTVINKYGVVSFLELKNGATGIQTDNQKYFEQEIKCRGGNYVLIRTFDDCVEFVKEDLIRPKWEWKQVEYKCGNVQTTGADVSAFTSTSPTLNAELKR